MAKDIISTDLNIELKNFSSDYIKPSLFGAGYIVDKDSLDGTYEIKVDAFGITSVRYPGGGVAENFFNMKNPNIMPLNRADEQDTLSEFLEFCAEHSIQPVIVIPTKIWKYRGIDEGVQVLSDFIKKLTAGEYGDASNAIIEIGNEYYNSFTDYVYHNGEILDGLSGSEYGEIASKFAIAIEQSASHDLEIAVQIGKTDADNAEILAHFNTTAEKAAVDILVYHDYFWREDAVEGRADKSFDKIDSWKSAGIDAEIFVSEWNVGSSKDNETDSEHDYGLAQMSAMVEFVSEAAKHGVDMASVWAVQSSNKTALSRNEGDLKKVSFAGHIFEFMSEHLIGSKVLDIPIDSLPNDQASIHVFESGTEIIVIISAGDFDDENTILDFNINLSGLGSEFSSVSATKVWSNLDPNNPKGWVREEDYDPEMVGENGDIVHVELDGDHQVITLVFTKSVPEAGPLYDQGTIADDLMVGSEFDDVFYGNDGDDHIDGGRGNDVLNGGAGDDQISDHGGNDQIYAGAGDDQVNVVSGSNIIHGGTGDDVIVGGIQSDTIYGGGGNDIISGDIGSGMFGGADIIVGGKGNDILMGGLGADTFEFSPDDGSDIIANFIVDGMSTVNIGSDFQIGVDQILLRDFSGIDSSNVMDFVTYTDYGAIFEAEGTEILLYGLDNSSLTADDFNFI